MKKLPSAPYRGRRRIQCFTQGDDPYGEHDFEVIDHGGEKFFWKIDYYDNRLEFASEDPSDPEKTRRILTIMLADEY